MEHHYEPVPTHAPAGLDPHSAEYEYAFTPTGAGYEHTDASVWIIVKFALWLAVSAAVIHVGVWVLFYLFVEQRDSAQVNEFPLAPGAAQQRLPAEPRLQQFPMNEYYEYRQRENAAVEGYRWVDRNAGTVQIPIAEAMRLAIERGLPATTTTPATTTQAPPPAAADTPGAPPAAPAAAAPAATPASPGVETLGLVPSDSSAGRMMERRRQ